MLDESCVDRAREDVDPEHHPQVLRVGVGVTGIADTLEDGLGFFGDTGSDRVDVLLGHVGRHPARFDDKIVNVL